MSAETEVSAQPEFRLLFEGSPHPYLVVRPDAAFTIVAVNNRYLEATGTRRAEILGRGLFEVFPDNPDDPSATGVSDLRSSLDRVVRDRVQDIMGVQKYDIPRREGGEGFEVRYWSPVNTPVFGSDGKIALVIHHVEDVTEFILSQQRSSETAQRIEKVQARADRMEAEVLRRANEVKDSNRRLKAAMEALERSQAELTRLNERLKELDRAKTVFFSNISHEFRTPLTLLLGLLEDTLGRGDGALPAEDREQLTVAHRNGLRLLKLVNALLDFSRLEAGRVQATYRPTDLSILTANLASVFRAAIEKAGLELVVDTPPLPGPVYVDRDLWEKVVLNLLSNAFKFTHRGQIAVRQRAAGDRVELSVEDTGCGIPESELCNVFQRFYRVEGTEGRSHEGTGIGLALVEELVKLHGGTVRVTSAVGRGSTFTVSLPFGAGHLPADRIGAGQAPASTPLRADAYVEEALRWLPDGDADATAIAAAADAAPPGGQRRLVLVADDNADMRDYVRRLLSAHFDVVAVPDGEAAWTAVRERRPDLVLTDVMMPRLDGFGLLTRLRQDAGTRTLPVIVLSARAGEESRVEGLEAGADDYLVKPFSGRELVARVRTNLELARLREESARLEAQLETAAERERLLAVEQEARRQAEQAVRLRDEFLSIAAHELKTPVTSLRGYAQLLARQYEKTGTVDPARVLVAMEQMQRQSIRLSRLTEQLLDVGRLDAGKLVLDRKQTDLAELVERLIDTARHTYPERALVFCPGDQVRAIVDPVRLEQVLANLLDNAAKFSPRTAHIEFSLTLAPGGWAELVVRDYGDGVPESDRERIFERFYQGHGERSIGGMGIGLFISRQIVEMHGGTIWCEPADGKGSCFVVRLPALEGSIGASGGGG